MTPNQPSIWPSPGQSAVARLARFFPEAWPVRLAVTVTRKECAREESEATVIEFGTPREALFICCLPLEFAERLELRSLELCLRVEARVVAVHYHQGQAAVAARFMQPPACWAAKEG